MNTNTIRNRLISIGRALLLGLTCLGGQAQAQATLSYDGIYQWSPGNFLSLHQDGTAMIATVYFTNDGSFSFPAPAGGGVLPVPQLDLFDLMGGPVTGSTAQMDGTRFHRECNVGYDFTFNSDATITVTRIGVSNTPAADLAHISCSSIIGMEPATMIVPKIRFNPSTAPVCALPQVLTNGVCVTPPPVCTLPQVLTNGVCVTPPPVCALPQVLTNGVCVTPPPVCTLPQVLTNGVCVTPPPPLASQVINFPAPGNHGVGDFVTLTASSTSRLFVSFTTNDPKICDTKFLPFTGPVLLPNGIGTCTITASQPGNSVYAPAVPVTRSILISAATAPTPQVPPGPSYSTTPLVHSIPAPVYTSSYDAQTLDVINAARDSCGFGKLKQDVRLDKAANAHSKYMLYNNYLGHYEDSAKPMYTGVTPADRMAAAGYSNIYDSSEDVTQTSFTNLSEMSANIPSVVSGFLSAPYHALEMLAPRLDIGIANQWNSNVGLPVDPLNPYQNVAVVYDYGVPGVIQDLPSNQVVSYPCDGSRVAPALYAESPSPFPSRNLNANPVGGSIYLAAKYGSNIQVTSSALVNVATGQPVTLLAPRYGDKELYPGTGSKLGSALLMNWVFITPDLPLSPSTAYRFTISGTVSGLPFTKTATYQTNAY